MPKCPVNYSPHRTFLPRIENFMKLIRQKNHISKITVALFLLLCLPVWSLAVSASEFDNEYIGYQHKGVGYGKKLPNGVRDMGGGLLSDEDYGVTRFTKGKKYMLWLEKIVQRDKNGVPDWEVKDVLIFENLSPTQEFFLSESSPCTIDGLENPDMIVLAEKRPKINSYKVIKVWLVNLVKEKFFEIPKEGISCVP